MNVMFTLAVFEILPFEGRLVLSATQLGTRSERVSERVMMITDTHMEELVLYRKNPLKYKVGCF